MITFVLCPEIYNRIFKKKCKSWKIHELSPILHLGLSKTIRKVRKIWILHWKFFAGIWRTSAVNRSLGTKGKRYEISFNLNMSMSERFFLTYISHFLKVVLYQKFKFPKYIKKCPWKFWCSKNFHGCLFENFSRLFFCFTGENLAKSSRPSSRATFGSKFFTGYFSLHGCFFPLFSRVIVDFFTGKKKHCFKYLSAKQLKWRKLDITLIVKI